MRPWGRRGLRQHKVLEMGWLPETGTEDLEAARDWGICGGDGSRGPPLPDEAFLGCDPRGLLAWGPTYRRAGPSRARSQRPLHAARTPEPTRGQRGARGRGWAQWCLAVTCSTRRRTRPHTAPDLAGPGRSRESVCAPEPRRLGHRGFQNLGTGPCPRDRPRRTRAPGAPVRPADCPGAGLGRGRGRARMHLCPPFLPAARSWRRASPGPRVPGARRERPGRGRWAAAAGRCGVRPAPRRVRPAEAALRAVRRVRGAPAAIQLPGLISSLGVRLGAGSQRAAAAAPRSASRTEPAAGGAAGTCAPAPGPGKRGAPAAARGRAGPGRGGRGCCRPSAAPRTRRGCGAAGRCWGLGCRPASPSTGGRLRWGRAGGTRIPGGGRGGEGRPRADKGRWPAVAARSSPSGLAGPLVPSAAPLSAGTKSSCQAATPEFGVASGVPASWEAEPRSSPPPFSLYNEARREKLLN